MAYQSWSVVFGEQPSAAKWNILGTNDASFNDGSGFATGVLQKNPYSFSAYRSSNQTVTDAALTVIVWNAELSDPNSNFDVSTGTYTIPVTGLYQFNCIISWAGTGISDAYCQLYVNATDTYRIARQRPSSDVVAIPSSSIAVPLTAADTVQIQGFCNVSSGSATASGAADGLGDISKFSGFLVHPT